MNYLQEAARLLDDVTEATELRSPGYGEHFLKWMKQVAVNNLRFIRLQHS